MYQADSCVRPWSEPSGGGATVQALAVVADQDRAVASFAHGSVDGAGRARHQRDQGGLSPLPMMRRT